MKRVNRSVFALAAVMTAISALATPSLIPLPRQIAQQKGAFAYSGDLSAALAQVKYEQDATVPAEGYRLTITTNDITIVSSDDAGKYYAVKTLRQLASVSALGVQVPCMEIEDSPSYPWRGVHLDECRHFFGKEVVKTLLNLMAQYKLNRFHWHLTDDQGWRLEVPGYPELVKYGAVRSSSVAYGKRAVDGDTADADSLNGEKYGPFFYTEADIREIVAYAAERHIQVVPEIELPGHVAAALAAYPEFACKPENFAAREPRIVYGIAKDVLCVGNDDAIKFMEDVFEYVCRIFPGDVVHIGGDECPPDRWKDCQKCKARISAEGLDDHNGLQPWITRHFVDFIAKCGKRAVVWNARLAGALPSGAIVMSGGEEGVDASAEHDIVMTPSSYCRLDYGQGLLADYDPFMYTGGNTSLERCYQFNPRAGVPDSAKPHILGGQANNWTEYTLNMFDLEWKMYPRMFALAEALWLGEEKPGYQDFKGRATHHRGQLMRQGVNCAPMPTAENTSDDAGDNTGNDPGDTPGENPGDTPGDDSGTGTDDNATGVNLVTNGTFEDGSSYDGGTYAYATVSGVTLPTGWTFSSIKSGISKTSDNNWHKGNAVAVEGSNWSAFLQENDGVDGGFIEQDVAFPSAGSYTMEFMWISRYSERNLCVEILLGGESVKTITRDASNCPYTAYEKIKFTVDIADAETKRLKIVQKKGYAAFCIDQVAVYSTQPSEPVKTFTVSVQETVCLGEDGRAEPPVTVTDTEGNVLTAGTHYTVTYSDNTAVGTGKVTVTGIAPYSGTVDKTFEILPGNTGDTPGDDSGTGTDDDATGVNLVTNGTFEEGTVCSKGWEYSYDAVKDGVTLPNGWTFSSEKSGISKTADGTWHIGNTEAVKGSNWSVFLQEYQYGDGGSIEQDVTFSSKGSYTMEFMWIGRPNESWKTLGVEILLDDDSIATVTRAKEARPDAAYEKVSFTFDVAEKATKRLKIVQKHGNGSFCIDQVAVYSTKAGPSGFLIIVR